MPIAHTSALKCKIQPLPENNDLTVNTLCNTDTGFILFQTIHEHSSHEYYLWPTALCVFPSVSVACLVSASVEVLERGVGRGGVCRETLET